MDPLGETASQPARPQSAQAPSVTASITAQAPSARQDALARADELAVAFEAITDGVVIYGPGGEVRMMNRPYRRLLAMDESMLGDQFDARAQAIAMRHPATGHPFSPEDYPAARILRGETLEGAGSVDVLARAHDGRDVLLNCAGAPLRDANGQPAGAVMVIRDVGKRRGLEREVAEQAAQLMTLVETMPDAAALFAPDGTLLLVNTAFRRLFGIADASDFFTRSVEDRRRMLGLHDPEGDPLPPEKSPFERVVRRGEVLIGVDAIDIVAERADGRRIELEVVGTPVRDGEGDLLGGVLLYRDVTERRRLERRTHDALSALLATAHALVATDIAPADDSGVRGLAARLAGLARQVLGCEIVSLLGVDATSGRFVPLATVGRTPENEAAWYATVAAAGPADFYSPVELSALRAGETIVVNPGGSHPRVLPTYGTRMTAAAPLTTSGRIEGLLSAAYGSEAHAYTADELELVAGFAQMAHLVLQRERLQGEREDARARTLALVEATRRMDDFLGIASHELRTPLTSVTANIQLANRHLRALRDLASPGSDASAAATDDPPASDGDAAKDMRERIERAHLLLDRTERQAARMDRLVGDLLDVARIQADRLEFRMEPCDVLAIVRDVAQEQRSAWPARALALDLPSRATVPIYADPDRVGQVVTNYLSNALKYSPAESAVRLRVRLRGGEARIEVSDAGPGLTPEQRAHLFERFYRVPGIERQSGSGVGPGAGTAHLQDHRRAPRRQRRRDQRGGPWLDLLVHAAARGIGAVRTCTVLPSSM